MSSDRGVRPLHDDDLTAVESLLRTEWPDVDWQRRFDRQWRDNPTVAPTLPRGFVYEHAGQLVGFFGSIPVPYQVDGRDGLACIATALCVDPAARGHGVARALVAAFDAQPADLRVNATPNAASSRLFAALSYTCIDPAAGRHLLAHARQPFGLLRRAWRARKRGMLRTLLRPTRTIASALRCARIDAATTELDVLWLTHRSAHPTTLTRNRTTLQWLLFADPHCTVIGCREATGSLRGYAAFRIARDELRQIDTFPAHDDEVSFALGLAGAELAANAGVATVRLLSVPARAAQRLVASGFEPVTDDLAILLRGADSRGAWLTRVDGDLWL